MRPTSKAFNGTAFPEVEPVQWLTARVVVPAMNLPHYRYVGHHQPLWAKAHGLSVFTYQNARRGAPHHVPKSPPCPLRATQHIFVHICSRTMTPLRQFFFKPYT